jgi:hypothetical protein
MYWASPRQAREITRLIQDRELKEMKSYPVTPDGRYLVVRGRLWRTTTPSLSPEARQVLVHELMRARKAKGEAMRRGDGAASEAARQRVNEVKHQLGERGQVWWTDGTPDWNRHMVANTPYAEWFKRLSV